MSRHILLRHHVCLQMSWRIAAELLWLKRFFTGSLPSPSSARLVRAWLTWEFRKTAEAYAVTGWDEV